MNLEQYNVVKPFAIAYWKSFQEIEKKASKYYNRDNLNIVELYEQLELNVQIGRMREAWSIFIEDNGLLELACKGLIPHPGQFTD